MTLSEFITKNAIDSKQRIISNLVRGGKEWFESKGYEKYYDMLLDATSFLNTDASITLRIFAFKIILMNTQHVMYVVKTY